MMMTRLYKWCYYSAYGKELHAGVQQLAATPEEIPAIVDLQFTHHPLFAMAEIRWRDDNNDEQFMALYNNTHDAKG